MHLQFTFYFEYQGQTFEATGEQVAIGRYRVTLQDKTVASQLGQPLFNRNDGTGLSWETPDDKRFEPAIRAIGIALTDFLLRHKVF